MKGRIVRSLLGVMFVSSLLVLSTTAQEPATMLGPEPPLPDSRTNSPVRVPSGITSLDGSTVTAVWPLSIVYAIDFQYDLCFDVTVVSNDAEYMDRFDVDLPDYWSVVGIYPQAPTGCPVDTIAGVDADNIVYWQIDGDIPSNCGPWYGDVQFCVRIEVPYCFGDPWTLPWNIIGDGYGSDPHQVSGSTDPLNCVPAGLYIDASTVAGNSCQGVTNTIVLNLANHTGAEGTFSLAYDVNTNNGTLSGPDEIYLGAGADQDFVVDLTPQPCLRLGELVSATLIAQGNGFDDITNFEFYIKEDETCVPCQSTYLPCILKDY
jgi:hypothetical protein